MHPKIKSRPASGKSPTPTAAKPLLLHDVTNQAASAKAASRQRIVATQPASGTANHSRHHTSRNTQA